MKHFPRLAFSAVAAWIALCSTGQFGDRHHLAWLNSGVIGHGFGAVLLPHCFFAFLLLTCLFFPPLRVDPCSDQRWVSFLAHVSITVSVLGIALPFLGATGVGFGHMARSRSLPKATPTVQNFAFLGLVLGYLGLSGWLILSIVAVVFLRGA